MYFMITFELFILFDTLLAHIEVNVKRYKQLKYYHEKNLKCEINLTKFDYKN